MKTFSAKAKFVFPILAVALVFTIWAMAVKPEFITAMAKERQIPIYCVKREYKVVSLTFDAAWGNEDTEQLIEILGRYNIKATFFIVGDWVRKYPESVKHLFDAGHEIMSHSNHHDHMTRLSSQQIIDDLNACNQDIAAITGVTPDLFRCPYGEYDDKVVNAVKSIGMETIQWDVDSHDWMDKTADQIQTRVLERVKPGSIVLFHNAAKNTPEALEGIIPGLIQKGYVFSTIGNLIHRGECVIDHTGMQIPVSPLPAG